MILAGNVALESCGFQTFGFAREGRCLGTRFGRILGTKTNGWHWVIRQTVGIHTVKRRAWLEDPLAAVQMGLIYVNPEGPDGNPDPVAAAHDIRKPFSNGHERWRNRCPDCRGIPLVNLMALVMWLLVGDDPEAADLELQGFGWSNKYGSGKAGDAITSGLEVVWTSTPVKWSNDFFKFLFGYEWELTKSPAGAINGLRKMPRPLSPILWRA